MKIPRTQRAEPLDDLDRKCPAYRNQFTAWWDASQIYGDSESQTKQLRSSCEDGKLKMDEKGCVSFLPRDDTGLPVTGVNINWWMGIELVQTLFALEHNAICDMLHAKYPNFSKWDPQTLNPSSCC
jgi:Animal haem peroxidase